MLSQIRLPLTYVFLYRNLRSYCDTFALLLFVKLCSLCKATLSYCGTSSYLLDHIIIIIKKNTQEADKVCVRG